MILTNRRVWATREHIGLARTLQVAGKPVDSAEMQFEKTELTVYNAT
jgi:hypothetical protein